MTSALRHLGCWLWLAAVSPVLAAEPPAEPSPESVLQARGLKRLGPLWCLADEADLKDRLAALDRLEKRFNEARQTVEQLVEQNEAYGKALAQAGQAEQRDRELLAAAKAGSPQHRQIEADLKAVLATIDKLRRLYVTPEKLAGVAPAKPAAIELINVRTELALRLLPLRKALDNLTARYETLRRDAGVTAALAALGSDEHLGPSHTLRDLGRTLDRLQPLVFSDSMPVYREGKYYRVAALVNDLQPLTFSFVGTGERTVIPQNLAEAVGLTAAAAPTAKIRIEGNREVTAAVIKIPSLRFGRHVFHDVEAYILPPEAADMGARIGAAVFVGHRVQLGPGGLSLTIEGN